MSWGFSRLRVDLLEWMAKDQREKPCKYDFVYADFQVISCNIFKFEPADNLSEQLPLIANRHQPQFAFLQHNVMYPAEPAE